jgi:hypothetical protein
MFKPTLSGKYIHPWLKPLPAGRAAAYDLAYKATSTLLFGFACYGLFEVCRASWFITRANARGSAADGTDLGGAGVGEGGQDKRH